MRNAPHRVTIIRYREVPAPVDDLYGAGDDPGEVVEERQTVSGRFTLGAAGELMGFDPGSSSVSDPQTLDAVFRLPPNTDVRINDHIRAKDAGAYLGNSYFLVKQVRPNPSHTVAVSELRSDPNSRDPVA